MKRQIRINGGQHSATQHYVNNFINRAAVNDKISPPNIWVNGEISDKCLPVPKKIDSIFEICLENPKSLYPYLTLPKSSI